MFPRNYKAVSFRFPKHSVCIHIAHENRSPFGLLNGVLLSYLLFSTTRCPSVVGACLVGAGSLLDSWLGEPAVSVRAGPPFESGGFDPPIVADDSGLFGTLSEYSRESTMDFFRRCSSARAWRSALMPRLAKKYAAPPATEDCQRLNVQTEIKG